MIISDKPAQSSHNGVKLSPNPDSLPKFPPKFRTKKIIQGNYKSSNHCQRKITQFTTPIILSKSESQDNITSGGTPLGPRMDHSVIISWIKNIPLVEKAERILIICETSNVLSFG